MSHFQKPWGSAATVLAATTLAVSLVVSYLVNGSFFHSVGMVDLRIYGGTTFEDLMNFEIWRMAVAQLLHSKFLHMLFNVMCLFLLGNMVEKIVGTTRFLLLWLLAGGIATVISPAFVQAPWNVGTGASQAVFAFAGCATIFVFSKTLERNKALALIILAIGPGLLLDFVFAGYPKIGHVAGFTLGCLFGLVFLKHRGNTSVAV